MKKIFIYISIMVLLLPIIVFANDYSDTFKKITSDGTYVVTTVLPEDPNDLNFLAAEDILIHLGGAQFKYMVEVNICAERTYDPVANKEICTLKEKDENGYYDADVTISVDTGNKAPEGYTIYDDDNNTLKIKFIDTDDQVAKGLVNGIVSEINNKQFILNDLAYINFINSIPKGNDETSAIWNALVYSDEFREKIGNKNIKIHNDPRAGDTAPWDTLAFGFTSFIYNGNVIGVADRSGTTLRNIVYVPDDTEDTDDAYIAAVMKRINAYFGVGSGITITRKGSITDALDAEACNNWPYTHYECIPSDILNDYYNSNTNKLDSIYEITTKEGNKNYILIEKDSSKMKTPKFTVSDSFNNINISSDNGNIPLDTIFKAVYVNEGETYNDIKSRIKGDFTAVDLSLYSEVKFNNITKLDNGNFKVSIPVPANLEGKSIYVYYITSTGELEEHVATVKDGFAVFETDHFSTYILAEKQTSNPKTGDTIMTYVMLIVLSLLGINALIRLFKKSSYV